MTAEGTKLYINGDEYIVDKDYGEMLVLKKGNYLLIYFPTWNIMIPCGTKKCPKKVEEDGIRLSFAGVTFPVRGYNVPTHKTKEVFVSLTEGDFVFRITNTGELLTVRLK